MPTPSFEQCDAARGLSAVASHVYRGFVFARLSAEGPDFDEYFGAVLSSIDYLADRSPEGELEVVGGVLRYMHDSNWKMFVENLNDTMHPMVAHESAAGTAKRLWADKPEDEPKPMAVEQLVPFASAYGFFDKMGVRVFENGHSYSGVHFSIHSSYSEMPGYEAAMVAAYGEERARDILGTVRHNTVYYPSLTIKGAIQSIRVVRPVAVDKTVVESWTFRLKGAPEEILHRTITYNRLINSPLSIVGHDDQYCYRVIQEGLAVGRQRVGEPAAGLGSGGGRAAGPDGERHERDLDAQPVPCLDPLHGAGLTRAELSPLRPPRGAAAG